MIKWLWFQLLVSSYPFQELVWLILAGIQSKLSRQFINQKKSTITITSSMNKLVFENTTFAHTHMMCTQKKKKEEKKKQAYCNKGEAMSILHPLQLQLHSHQPPQNPEPFLTLETLLWGFGVAPKEARLGPGLACRGNGHRMSPSWGWLKPPLQHPAILPHQLWPHVLPLCHWESPWLHHGNRGEFTSSQKTEKLPCISRCLP